MEKLRFQCRVEKKLHDHAVFMDDVQLGQNMVLVQCLGCGVMGVMDRRDQHGAI